MAEELVRTNIRLTRAMHSSLKQEALNQGTTIEDLVRTAIQLHLSGVAQIKLGDLTKDEKRILGERKFIRDIEVALQDLLQKARSIETQGQTDEHRFLALTAVPFLICLPVPVLIRTKSQEVVWKSPAYAATFGDDDWDNLEQIDQDDRSTGSLRSVSLKVGLMAANDSVDSYGTLLFDSIQFPFSDSGEEYVGDLLLPRGDLALALQGKKVWIPLFRPSKEVTDSAAARLECLSAFLEHLPVAAAIKDLNGRYCWVNGFALKNLAKAKSKQLVGKTTAEFFNVSDASGIEEQEQLVKSQKEGLIALVRISKEIHRPGLRFPLLDPQGRVTHLGSIGTGAPPVSIAHR